MELVILTGLQASGKSTFYYRHFYNSHVRVNLDMLNTRNKERALVAACLSMQQKFVVDNTNVTKEERQIYITLAKCFKYKIIGYYFESTVEDCIFRNDKRVTQVPTKAIIATKNRLEVPRYSEGFDQLFVVDLHGNEFYVRELIQEIKNAI